MVQRILVVGGGLGGMAFAIQARRTLEADIDIVEADPNWRVYGAGITVTSPTYRALRQLDLLDEVCADGFFATGGARICSVNGAHIAELPMPLLGEGLPSGGGIARPRLHSVFSGRVRSLGANVRLGVTVERFVEDRQGVTAHFSDGSQQTYDFVVAADGAFSQTRSILFPELPAPAYTGQYCWRINAPRPAEIDRPHFYFGPGANAGLVPISNDMMYMFLLEAAPAKARIPDSELPQRLRQLMAPFGGPLAVIRESLTAETDINARPLDAILVPPPWHRGRILLIGDAAHATTPHLASGAGIAMEDGIVLAEELRDQPDPERAFRSFVERRFERCRLVVESSVKIGRLQQEGAADAIGPVMHEAQVALRAEI